MSSRPPQTLSSAPRSRRLASRPPNKLAIVLPINASSPPASGPPAALRPRPANPHRSRPKPRLFLPAVSSLRGFRTPAPRLSPTSPAKGRRPKPFSEAEVSPKRKRKFHPSVISCVPNPLAATDETVSPTAPISCVVQSTKYSCEVAFFCLPDLPSQKIVMLPLQFLGESRGSVAARVSAEIES